jgi:hypothetical protein
LGTIKIFPRLKPKLETTSATAQNLTKVIAAISITI